MNKTEFLVVAQSLGWQGPDRHGHLKHTAPSGTVWRLKLQKISWRLESQSVVPATRYSPASKLWHRRRSGYYSKTEATGPAYHRVPQPPGSPSSPQ